MTFLFDPLEKAGSTTLTIFIGYDSKEDFCAKILAHTIRKYSNHRKDFVIIPLIYNQLYANEYTSRKLDKRGSTEFSMTRFLCVPITRLHMQYPESIENKYKGLKPTYLQYPVITSVKPNVTGKMGGGMMRYKTGNAVKLSPKQKVIAAKAPPMNRIDGKDFDVLKAEKAKGRGQGLQDEKMKPGKIMKADKGVFAEKLKKANRRPRTLLDRDLPLKTERLRGMTPEKLNKMLEEYNKKNSNKPDFKPKFLKKMGGGMMKADKGIAVDFDEKRKTTYNVKDVYKLANENKTGARPTSEDVRQAAKFLKVKLNPKTR